MRKAHSPASTALTANIGTLPPRTAFEIMGERSRPRRGDTSESGATFRSESLGYEDLDDEGDWIE